MMTYIPSTSRGGGDYGWLKTRYSFSFANYYDPMKMGFGALRVINDDWIGPQSGFGKHQHANMEIITIPFLGTLSHKDSTGGEGDIRAGEVQVMSAGTGVVHSEYNHGDEPVELFQIWIEPKSYGVAPRYDQKTFDFNLNANKLVLLVSPDGHEESLVIHQDALIYRGVYSEDTQEKHQITPGKGVYLIMREGQVKVDDMTLTKGDAFSVSEESELVLDIHRGSDFMLLEVPPFHNAL
ncbi:MAG: pirin family protein [Candidatus Moranbacteria bacterium]|nr:pirin family protein [Candidatus Moranbacteria bacterium]